MTDSNSDETKSAAELLREVADLDPQAHWRAVGRGYGVGSIASLEPARSDIEGLTIEVTDQEGEARQESAGEMLARLGTDGEKWAAEFVATWQRLAFKERRGRGILVDPTPGGFLHAWFANAIEAGRVAGMSDYHIGVQGSGVGHE